MLCIIADVLTLPRSATALDLLTLFRLASSTLASSAIALRLCIFSYSYWSHLPYIYLFIYRYISGRFIYLHRVKGV